MASSAGIAAIVDETVAPAQGQETLLHEVAHHFMKQYRPLPYPAWYVEGFAEYASTVSFKKDAIEYGRPSLGRAYTLVQGKWLPLDEILFGEVPSDRERMSAFYRRRRGRHCRGHCPSDGADFRRGDRRTRLPPRA